MSEIKENRASRREFLNRSGRIAAASALGVAAAPAVHAGEDNMIKVALVGCGGRGTGAAADALGTKSGPIKLVAMADVFDDRLQSSHKNLTKAFAKQMDVPKDRQFIGFDAYKKAIDCLDETGLVLLATPPAWRPIHLEHAVAKGVNVFMEKSFAVDGPGIRRVLKAGQEASKKNLKIAGGLMTRHSTPAAQAVEQIHGGRIGDVITCWAYREHGPVGMRPKSAGMTEMAHQIRNYNSFTWLNGSFMLDWMIHNLDVCCWVKNAWPVSAQGHGGRQVRTAADQLFDHYAVEYSFADGTRMFAQGRHMDKCWNFWGDVIHGAKGSAVLGEGVRDPLVYKGHNRTKENVIWRYKGEKVDPYQVELDRLVEAIRQNKRYNETERCAYAALAGILGRMAAESGKEITWKQALASNLVQAPGLESFTMDSDPPVVPDAKGQYPIAMPGRTKAL